MLFVFHAFHSAAVSIAYGPKTFVIVKPARGHQISLVGLVISASCDSLIRSATLYA